MDDDDELQLDDDELDGEPDELQLLELLLELGLAKLDDDEL